ncbi:MAG: universal stress protein [Desulfobacteraceae bacterium]|nr:MAG: universal stress protein [Desulfobacteraceae bacterium]
MLDYKNILYAIDLDAEKIFSVIGALEFAQRFQSRLHVLYVNDLMAGYRHATDREDTVALRIKETVPESLLENSNIIYASAKGNTAEEILKYALEQQIDLIIVGHKHRGKVYASMFDSTDVNILDETLLPVLVIPEKQ